MVHFTNSEFADINYMYGLADGNSLEAKRLYEERFPNNPDTRTFSNIHRRLFEKGRDNHLKGLQRTVRRSEIQVAVLNLVEEDPGLSTRKIGNSLNISHILVWKILHDFLLYPYHIQWVQTVLPPDFPLQINFCQWFHQKLYEKSIISY